jgi:hypothetical protein
MNRLPCGRWAVRIRAVSGCFEYLEGLSRKNRVEQQPLQVIESRRCMWRCHRDAASGGDVDTTTYRGVVKADSSVGLLLQFYLHSDGVNPFIETIRVSHPIGRFRRFATEATNRMVHGNPRSKATTVLNRDDNSRCFLDISANLSRLGAPRRNRRFGSRILVVF